MINLLYPIGPRRHWRAALLSFAVLAAGSLAAQTPQSPSADASKPPTSSSSAKTRTAELPPKKFTIGGRLSLFGLKGMRTSSTSETLAGPVAVTKSTSSSAPMGGGGIGMEYFLTRRFSLSLDIIGHKTGYSYFTEKLTGTPPASGVTDIRAKLHIMERTKATNWDMPVLLRYNGAFTSRWLRHTYYGGGIAMRMVSGVKTSTDYSSYVNGEAAGVGLTLENPVGPRHRIVPGAVICGGWRFRDEFSLKVTPELRYTRWLSSTYDVRPMSMRRDQVEFVLGIGW